MLLRGPLWRQPFRHCLYLLMYKRGNKLISEHFSGCFRCVAYRTWSTDALAHHILTWIMVHTLSRKLITLFHHKSAALLQIINQTVITLAEIDTESWSLCTLLVCAFSLLTLLSGSAVFKWLYEQCTSIGAIMVHRPHASAPLLSHPPAFLQISCWDNSICFIQH